MPTYLHPGVYIEEIPSGSKPIEGVSTSVAAFIGYCLNGPMKEARLIHKWDDYVIEYGGIMSDADAMGLAVWSFFLNGGTDAYVMRLASNAESAKLPDKNAFGKAESSAKTTDVLTIKAKYEGTWGNDLHVRIKNSGDDLHFRLEVGFSKDGRFSAVEVFDNLTMDPKDTNYVVTAVNANSKYVTVDLTDALKSDPQLYTNGSSTSDDLSNFEWAKITPGQTLTLDIDGLGAKTIEINKGLSDGNAFADHIKELVKKLGSQDSYQDFSCTYDNTTSHKLTLISGTRGPSSSVVVRPGELAKLLKLGKAMKSEGSNETHGTVNVVPAGMTDVAGFSESGNLSTCINLSQVAGKTLKLNINSKGEETITLNATGSYTTPEKVW
ncbi:MAG: hypothetical protein HGA78_04900 [Nitrospirales bacterium]|nr:hypothetical protein [Nitrospirales bacterium]